MPTALLAIYRRKKGLSQEELSARSGVSARTIQRIEKGQVVAHLATLKLLAESLEVDIELLLEKTPTEPGPSGKKDDLLPLFDALALVGLFCPILNIILPGFFWLLKKNESKAYDRRGRQVINFQLTMSMLFLPSVLLMVLYFPIGFPLMLLIYFFTMVMSIVNLFKTINQKQASYPFSLRFLSLDAKMG